MDHQGLGPEADPGRQAGGQAPGPKLVKTGIDPELLGVDDLHHRLARHQGAARLRVPGDHQGIHRGQQAQVGPLAHQGLVFGAHPVELLLGGFQVGLSGLEPGLRDLGFLALGLHRVLAGGLGEQQLFVALDLGGGEFPPGPGIVGLGPGGLDPGLGAALGRLLGGDPVVQVHRVHLPQQLARLDPFAHLHLHPTHAAGEGGADAIGVAGLQGPDAEEAGGDGIRRDGGQGHRHRGQGARGQGQPEEGGPQGDEKAEQGEGAAG